MSFKSQFERVKTRSKNFVLREIVRNRVEPSIFYAHGRMNLGDSMVPWLIHKITKHNIPFSNPLQMRGDHLFSIGSILQYANNDCYIWGSGFISSSSRPKGVPREVSAVRGPLTSAKLSNLGIQHPTIYGDPALLTSCFVDLKHSPIPNRIGFVPHFVDWPVLEKIRPIFEYDVEVVDIRTDDVISFCKKILECEVIISSSLHGIIIAESFGIPAIWCQISDGVVGGGFKFYDYFLSTGREVEPISMQRVYRKDILRFAYPRIKHLERIQSDLLAAFPNKFRY